MQALLAEKDGELAELRARVERIEARRGAIEELRALNEQTGQLKVGLVFGARTPFSSGKSFCLLFSCMVSF